MTVNDKCQISQIFTIININSKYFCSILVSFEFHKFCSHNSKAKVNIIVT